MAAVTVEGSTALVTGANRGIGRAIVAALAAAGAARIYAAVRRPETAQPLVDELGEVVEPVAFDLTDDASIRAAAETCADTKILVCNAGVLRATDVLADDVHESLDFEMQGNVHGLIRTARAFAPVLARNGGGALVQLNSVASLKCFVEFATYGASKAAAYAITQALRTQLAAQGTTVISVHPGPIATDMADEAGLSSVAEPPSVVADAIVEALGTGVFHVWPDAMARQMGALYEPFAKQVIEADLIEELDSPAR